MPRIRLDPDGTGNSQLGGIDTPLLSNDAANMDYVDTVAAAIALGAVPSGDTLPTMNTVAGQAFILLADDGDNTPGYYYRNSTNTGWIKDDTGGGLTIQDEGVTEGTPAGINTINFVGAGVSVTPNTNSVDVRISGEAETAPTLSGTGASVNRFQNPANQTVNVTFTATPSATTTFSVDGSGDLTNFVLTSAPTGSSFGTPVLNPARNMVTVPVTVNTQTVTSNVTIGATATLVVTSSGEEYPSIAGSAVVSVVSNRRSPTVSPTSLSRSVFNGSSQVITVNGMNTAANLNAGLAYDIQNTVTWIISGASSDTGSLTLSNGVGTQTFTAGNLLSTSGQATQITFDYQEQSPRLNGQTGTAPSSVVPVSFYTPWYYSVGDQPTDVTAMTSVERNFASSQTQRIVGTVGQRVWLATTGSSVTFILGASTTPGVMVGTLSRNNVAGQAVSYNLFRGPQLAAASSNFTITS